MSSGPVSLIAVVLIAQDREYSLTVLGDGDFSRRPSACGETVKIPTSRKGREKWGTPLFVSVNFNIKTNFKINGKGNGRECPFHLAGCRFAPGIGSAAEAASYFGWA